MIKIEDGRKQFYQWDLGQHLLIEGYAPGTEVHFAGRRNGSLVSLNHDGQTALIVEAYTENGKIYANVPNILLQSAGELCVFIYLKADDAARTAERKVINIIPRAKPNDYIYTETEVKRWEKLAENAENAIDAANTAVQNANNATTKALNAEYAAQGAASAANLAASYANEAAAAATSATTTANTATTKALNAEYAAQGAASAANLAASYANEAAAAANEAAEKANSGTPGAPGKDGKDGTNGKDGKSAYAYAVDGGYTGTEAEFAAKLASETSGIHVGTDAPTDESKVWIDTDEEPSEDEGGSAQIDVVAKAGQVIAVKAVDENSKPTEYKAVDLPKVTTPDYAANEGEDGYIANRTHYVDKNGIVHKLDNKYIDSDWMATKSENGGDIYFYANIEFANSTAYLSEYGGGFKVDQGFEFDVYWSGTKYACALKAHDGEPYIGNGSLGLSGAEDTGEPFCLYGSFMAPDVIAYVKKNTTTAETIELKVTTKLEVNYNKLPKEYLPDDVGGSIDVTAKVGQTIRVTAVDENGKPTEWEAADYQPRTHYAISEESEVLSQTDITVSSGMYQGSIAPTIEVGRTYTVVFDGAEYECVCSRTNPDYDGTEFAGKVLGNKSFMMSNDTDTGEPFCFVALDLGIWGIACASGSHTLKITGTVDTFVQKIPEKFYTDTKPYYVNIWWDQTTGLANVLNNSFEDIEYARTHDVPIYMRVTIMLGTKMLGSVEALMCYTWENDMTNYLRNFEAFVFAGTGYYHIVAFEQAEGTIGATVEVVNG